MTTGMIALAQGSPLWPSPRRKNKVTQQDEYIRFAECYDYIFPHWRQWLDVLCDRIDGVFRPHRIERVLDCACGTGVPSIGLALRGYEVTGCDLSASMLEKAEQSAQELGAPLTFCREDMTNLLARFAPGSFDAVVCVGNSISHLPTEQARLKGLRSMHAVLRDDGLLYLDARNWDEVVAEKQRFHLRTCRQFGQRHVTVLDVWDYGDDAIVLNIAVATEGPDEAEMRVFPVTCYPFSEEAMNRIITQAGFEVRRVAHESDRGFLTWHAFKSG